MRKVCHYCLRWIGRLANHKFFSLFLPWITGSYIAVIDVFNDRWEVLKSNQGIVTIVFWSCLLVSLVTQFVSGLTHLKPKLDSDSTARELLGEFISHVGIIVEEKLERFRSRIPHISSNADKFKHITQPVEQIGIIGREASQFLRSAYGLKEDQLDITILKRDSSGEWIYIYRLQSWSHGSTRWLVDRRSAAQQCSERSEVAFYPDKVKSAASGHYVLSDRDKRRKNGSAYIYPISFQRRDDKVDFVISIVTYGSQFNSDYDKSSSDVTSAFLREICRRFEIELCLDTIKSI